MKVLSYQVTEDSLNAVLEAECYDLSRKMMLGSHKYSHKQSNIICKKVKEHCLQTIKETLIRCTEILKPWLKKAFQSWVRYQMTWWPTKLCNTWVSHKFITFWVTLQTHYTNSIAHIFEMIMLPVWMLIMCFSLFLCHRVVICPIMDLLRHGGNWWHRPLVRTSLKSESWPQAEEAVSCSEAETASDVNPGNTNQ